MPSPTPSPYSAPSRPRHARASQRRPARRTPPAWLATLPAGSQQVWLGQAAWQASRR